MIVCKFGGSSVDGAAGIRRVADLVRQGLARRPIVVVSAMGKTTRRLLDCAEAAAAGNLAEALAGWDELRQMHLDEGRLALGAAPVEDAADLRTALDRTFDELRARLERLAVDRCLTPREADAVAGCGEVLASEILARALPRAGVPARWIDSRRVVVTDDAHTRARPLYRETNARLRAAILPAVERGEVPVLGGYVGATLEGVPTTLGKEGSDFSAAIVGAAVGADEVQIWTDVDGILTADPRLIAGARRVRTLSFAESLELACSGAKKPHPGTLGPAAAADVPIRILNSLRGADDASEPPGGEGTLIGRRNAAAAATVKSLACRANDLFLHLFPAAGRAAGFVSVIEMAVVQLRPALLVLRLDAEGALLALDHGDRLEEVRQALLGAGAADAPSADTGSSAVNANCVGEQPSSGTGPVGDLGVVHGRAVMSLVSEDFATDPRLVAAVLAATDEYQPRLVLAGVAAPVVRCLVELEDLPTAVAVVHRRLFGDDGPKSVEPIE